MIYFHLCDYLCTKFNVFFSPKWTFFHSSPFWLYFFSYFLSSSFMVVWPNFDSDGGRCKSGNIKVEFVQKMTTHTAQGNFMAFRESLHTFRFYPLTIHEFTITNSFSEWIFFICHIRVCNIYIFFIF